MFVFWEGSWGVHILFPLLVLSFKFFFNVREREHMRERESESAQATGRVEGEAGSQLSREPHAGPGPGDHDLS